MATLVNEGDIFLVRIEYTDANENKAYNVLHYRMKEINPTPPAVYTPQPFFDIGPLLMGQVADEWSANWKTGGSVQVRVSTVSVQNIYPSPKSYMIHQGMPDGGVPGEIVGDALPTQDAVTILKRTPYGSRKGLGRVFVPGIPESGAANGFITEAQQTLWDGLVVAVRNLQTAILDGVEYVWEPVLYAEQPGGPPSVLAVIEAQHSDRIIKTQRRRRPGKGI